VSGYRNEWPCCGDETYTQAWEPERCPFCELNEAEDRIEELETMLKVFLGCIETGLMPEPGSPCQRKIIQLVREPGDD